MKFIQYLFTLIIFCHEIEPYKILVAFPVGSKSIHNLMSSVGLALAEANHSVTHLTSFDPYVKHPNIEHLQPSDFAKHLSFGNLFQHNSQFAFLDWVNTLLTEIPHKIWKDPEIWKLYERRNDFDAIISTSYANEAILPFLDGYNGSYVIVCTPGVEYNCLTYSGNWMSGAVIPVINLPFDEFMSFYERVQNSIAFGIESLVEKTHLVPNFLKTIRNYFPHFDNVRDSLSRIIYS
ncbi:UNVERIFIED_CONTAM: hypothetical protein GTU68_039902 [Idotea baltica]|nr:hypothetical protein [Idotea baltica]MCL4126805.1 hypothetical protein [Idotea baltica]